MLVRNLLIVLLALSFGACKDSSTSASKKDNHKTEEKIAIHNTKYKLTPFSSSPSYSDAIINEFDYKNGKMDFKIPGKSYQLGTQTADAPSKMCANSGKGQHIHVIVDNKPYSAKYVANFDYDIADGEHYLLSFLSRSYHESIKSKDARIAKKIFVVNKTIKKSKDIAQPMVFYSRPKGTYVGKDTKKVMLDFYLVNADLKKGFKLEAKINGEIHRIPFWQPYYIEGLPMGENSIELTLFNKDGSKVNSPLNPVTRKFTLKEIPEG